MNIKEDFQKPFSPTQERASRIVQNSHWKPEVNLKEADGALRVVSGIPILDLSRALAALEYVLTSDVAMAMAMLLLLLVAGGDAREPAAHRA